MAILITFVMNLKPWRRLLQPKRSTSTFIINSSNFGLFCFFTLSDLVPYLIPYIYIYIYIYISSDFQRSFFQAAAASILLYGCTTWTLTKRLEKKLDGNYTRMLRAILIKSWRQHPHKTPTVRPPASYHENYLGRVSSWCTG